MTHYASLTLQNTNLIITTVLNDPYTMVKESSFKRSGNDQFEGYAIDLVQELSKILHFKYEFHLVKDRAYGRPDKNGTWNGRTVHFTPINLIKCVFIYQRNDGRTD